MQLIECLDITLSPDALESSELTSETIRYHDVLAYMRSEIAIWKILENTSTPLGDQRSNIGDKLKPIGKITSNKLQSLNHSARNDSFIRSDDYIPQHSLTSTKIDNVLNNRSVQKSQNTRTRSHAASYMSQTSKKLYSR